MESTEVNPQRILITGGAGYIGSILTPMLLQEGHQVTVLDNFQFSQASLLDCTYNPNLTVVNDDVRNLKTFIPLIRQADIIIPLAAIVGAPACDRQPNSATEVNLDQAKNIVEALTPAQKILFPVTNSGYGIGEQDKECDENSPLRPVSLYGRTKVEAEDIILKNTDAVCFRLATVFGASPRMRTDLMVNDFVLKALRDRYLVLFESGFRRNFIHVRDVANVFLFAIRNFENLKNNTYNIGLSTANLTKFQLCQKIKEQIPDLQIYENNFREDPDKRDYIVSNAKIEATGWLPQYDLDAGISELIRTYIFLQTNPFANV